MSTKRGDLGQSLEERYFRAGLIAGVDLIEEEAVAAIDPFKSRDLKHRVKTALWQAAIRAKCRGVEVPTPNLKIKSTSPLSEVDEAGGEPPSPLEQDGSPLLSEAKGAP